MTFLSLRHGPEENVRLEIDRLDEDTVPPISALYCSDSSDEQFIKAGSKLDDISIQLGHKITPVHLR